MLSDALIDSLFPDNLPDPAAWEQRYPPRDLPSGAEVTRFSPSPTGYLHIGGVYVAIIDADVALHSGGVYLPAGSRTPTRTRVAPRAPSRPVHRPRLRTSRSARRRTT